MGDKHDLTERSERRNKDQMQSKRTDRKIDLLTGRSQAVSCAEHSLLGPLLAAVTR